jgi:hypothetical protein
MLPRMSIVLAAGLLALSGAHLRADASQDVFTLFTKIASELSADNPVLFLESVDHDMPHYGDFETNLTSLAGRADLTCSLEILSDKGDDDHRVEQLDWFMQIVDKGDPVQVERRRDVVTFKLERRGKKWKIVSIDPAAFFGPPK